MTVATAFEVSCEPLTASKASASAKARNRSATVVGSVTRCGIAAFYPTARRPSTVSGLCGCVSVRAMAKSFTLTCPCCQGRLTIDAELEAVIAHEPAPPARAAKDLGAAFDSLRSKSAEREERFRQQMQAEAQEGKLLDREVQEGLKKAKEPPEPPRRP